MRVLSPRRDPPVLEEDGSTARTATRRFEPVRRFPKVSIKVDFPLPGGPDSPIRNEGRSVSWSEGEEKVCCCEEIKIFLRSSCACWYFLGWSVSTKVMASARLPRCPDKIPWWSRSTFGSVLSCFDKSWAESALANATFKFSLDRLYKQGRAECLIINIMLHTYQPLHLFILHALCEHPPSWKKPHTAGSKHLRPRTRFTSPHTPHH